MPGSSLQEANERGKMLLQKGRFTEAEDTVRRVLSEDPGNNDAMYLLAVCQRYRNDLSGALDTLESLKKSRPAYGRAFQEEGHVHVAAGKSSAAVEAYRHAISLNNSLIASWRALATLLTSQGDRHSAAEALQQFGKLDALPAELLSVRNMTAEGRVYRAERLCRHFLKANPRHVEGMRLLANLGVKSGVLDDAEFILESAVEFEPENTLARLDYVHVLYRRQKFEESHEQARILRDSDPRNIDYRICYANQCVAIGDYDTALEIYLDVISKHPDIASLHLVHGHALKTVGRVNDAVGAYRCAYTARRSFGDAYWSLANLKTYQFTAKEVSLMLELEADSATLLDDRVHFSFALGKHFENVEVYESAAKFYNHGNYLRRAQHRYDARNMSARLDLQKEVCTEIFLESKSGGGYQAPDPIFILGMPRAGSTLLEQILASHSQIDGTLELPDIPALAYRLNGRRQLEDEPRYPGILGELSAQQLKKFGAAYISGTRVHRRGAAFFIDKLPNNFRHIGLIHLILPNAKIIDARRHPMACCFSGYKQLFSTGQEFSYGMDDIGRYYCDYVELMDHWDEVLPGKILRVHYEDIVADTEAEVHRILDHCGLSFEQACVDFFKTERSIRTPSSEQVRQPIYTSGLEQWRNFEPWLDPLKSSLQPVLDRYPIRAESNPDIAPFGSSAKLSD
jgi:tetratricopeptide (TPR) repeat protein